MRLYRVTAECRSCPRAYREWITEEDRDAVIGRPEREVRRIQRCPLKECGGNVPILVSHILGAVHDVERTREALQDQGLRNLRLTPDERDVRPLTGVRRRARGPADHQDAA